MRQVRRQEHDLSYGLASIEEMKEEVDKKKIEKVR